MIDAYMDAPDQITIVRQDTQDGYEEDLAVLQNNEVLSVERIEEAGIYLTVWLTHLLDLNHFTYISWAGRMFPLLMGRYTLSIEFDMKYSTDQQMGATYSKDHTTFRVFAPTVI